MVAIDLTEFGLGAIESQPDERDWDIDMLYAATATEFVAAAPVAYMAPSPYPATLNQHNTPMCTAYSSSMLKGWEDLRDTGSANYDEPRFFQQIGGGPNGAVLRDAFIGMLNTGYPIVNVGNAAQHRIAAYYAVPITRAAIQSAIMAFGPITIGTPWFATWFRPSAAGVLPAPSVVVGGHAIVAIGWDARGLRLRNSWGTTWGISGDCWLPWSYLDHVHEAWKAIDKIEKPPVTTKYRVYIAHNAVVRNVSGFGRKGGKVCIKGWHDQAWTGATSSAPCGAPVIRRGCASGQATTVRVTGGTFRGKYVHIGKGVTVKTA
jgi:hypothetical protein